MSLRSALDRLLGRSEPSSPAPSGGGGRAAAVAHLEEFVRTRVGVEAYVEPPNAQTPSTVLLVATTGEWTRRRVPDERTGFEVARSLGVPVYNVRFTGYPQRMRDWNSAQRQERKGR
ncbi:MULTISPECIES: oxidoreductase [Isoptericola]|uniref:Oxidoreductase n=1 Tax=Isoptericola sediminis TaxID=2733572 RepID=A0A849K945_9MICO|nr:MULTISPECIES: oxidoreductase [Isoptericola]MDO8145235.1 oxidoreductase [Isoptericola sp. 178]MDO8148873.1 oxidoreductase [Isoptericola sp. b515]MDO8151185.1 oxidoreductase [Isoptericola sp. b408]NNU28529.1 oxidoreductase [Isoptericola sediminis]